MCSLELANKNSRELIEHFKDRWSEEELNKQLYLQGIAGTI